MEQSKQMPPLQAQEPHPAVNKTTQDVIHEHLENEEHKISEADIAESSTAPANLRMEAVANDAMDAADKNQDDPDAEDSGSETAITPWDILGA